MQRALHANVPLQQQYRQCVRRRRTLADHVGAQASLVLLRDHPERIERVLCGGREELPEARPISRAGAQ